MQTKRNSTAYKIPTGARVISRNVYQKARGHRGTIWGKWMKWGRHKTIAGNVKEAAEYAQFQLKMWNIGTVVYIKKGLGEPIPIYHAKLGHDKSRFMGWKSNPVADYWRRRV